MNTFLSSGLGATYPLMLWTAPLLLGVLVYAYLRKGRGAQVLVSSVLLLRKLKSFSSARRRFVPPLRFFFELLLLLLLLCAAAGVYFGGAVKRYAIVIDNSLSMLAGQPDEPGTTSLDLARNYAADLLQSLPSDAQVQVFTTAPDFRPVAETLSSPDSAQQLIREIKAAFSLDQSGSDLTHMLALKRYDQVVFFSDRKVDAPQNFARFFNARDVRAHTGSAEQANITLQRIALKRPVLAQDSGVVSVSAKSFSPFPVGAKVELRAISPGSSELRLLASKQISLAPHQSEQVEFDGIPLSASAFEASIEAVGRDAARANLLRWDDKAYLTGQVKAALLDVVSDLGLKELGLENLSSIEFRHFSPAQYEQGILSPQTSSAQPVLFHRYVPRAWPEVSAAFINPQPNQLFEVTPVGKAEQITDWLPSSALLDYANLAGIELPAASQLGTPEWAYSIISATSGSVAFSGERGGTKLFALGFELFPFEGKRNLTLSILTLNLLKQITGVNASQGYINTYSRLVRKAGENSARYITSTLYPLGVPQAGVWTPPFPGLFEIKYQSGEQELKAVNFFSEEESNLASTQFIILTEQRMAEEKTPEARALTLQLAWLVLLLVLLDLCWPLIQVWRRGRSAP